MNLTDAERDTMRACTDWAAPFEIIYHRHDATGEIISPSGQRTILGRLRNRGFVECGACNNTWRITTAGRSALAEGERR